MLQGVEEPGNRDPATNSRKKENLCVEEKILWILGRSFVKD